jgi:anthranilate phosphoribosyltransferase
MTTLPTPSASAHPSAPPSAHPFAQYVRILGRGKKGSRALTFDEARCAMTMIVADQVDPLQLGAFLMLLRVKEESPEELAGFVTAVRAAMGAPADTLRVDLDWSSYAGTRQHHPWYLLAALALADSGVRVLMHGAGGHTAGRLYTENALNQLGIAGCGDWSAVAVALDSGSFAYLPIARFCPPMAHMLQLKPILGLRSVANSLARILNPASASAGMYSIFHPRYAEVHQQTLQILRQANAAVFKGEGGEIERKPDAICDVLGLRDQQPSTQRWPRLLEERQPRVETPGVQSLFDVWRGQDSDRYGEAAITGTLAIAIAQLEKLDSIEDAQHRARAVWQSRNRSRL